MRRLFPTTLPIHLRIMALAVTAMLITILAMTYLVWRGPPPRPAPVTANQIAELVAGERSEIKGAYDIEVQTATSEPEAPARMMRAPENERAISWAMNVSPETVRVYVRRLGPAGKFPPREPPGQQPGQQPDQGQHEQPPSPPQDGDKSPVGDRPEPDGPPPHDIFSSDIFSPDLMPPERFLVDGPAGFLFGRIIKGQFVITVDLGDGSWLVLRTLKEPGLSSWTLVTALVLGLVFLLVMAVSWALSGQITWPLRELARQVRQSPAHRPDTYDESGAPEIRAVARALNEARKEREDLMNQRTDMLAAIAHDLQTPLARLAYRIDALPDASRTKANDDLAEMRLMIASVLDFLRSGAREAEMQKLDLSALLETVVEGYQDTGSPVQLADADRAIILGDPLTLRRMFANIIDNAIRYGGNADIALGKTGNVYEITIHDDGPGVAPDFLPRIFLPFSRENEARTMAAGTMGLGMAVARDIALQHGGSIDVRNRESGGLEVVVRLPAA